MNGLDTGYMPPQDLRAEEVVLGGILMGENALHIAMDLIEKEAFYSMENREAYKAILQLNERGKEIDIVTVVDQLKKNGTLQEVGGPGFIASLTNRVASDVHLEQHCAILKEKHMARKQIEIAQEIFKKAHDPQNNVFETLEYMSDAVHDIQTVGDVKRQISNEELAAQVVREIQEAKEKQGITGVPTGFTEQDRLFGGWQSPDLIIMAARPGMGKTAKALCDIYNSAVVHNCRIIIFSLEMSAVQLFKRLTSLATQVDANKFRTGLMTDEDWEKLHANLQKIITDNIIIVDDCYTVQAIRSRTKKERIKHDIDCVYVDYLQIMEGKGQTREQEISHISRSLKLLAKDINTPIVALSQLSRKVDERSDKRPKLSDLRESGAIEQDADVVTFLYRPQYYDEGQPGVAYLLVAKHRNGELKDIKLRYVNERTQFEDWKEEEKPF